MQATTGTSTRTLLAADLTGERWNVELELIPSGATAPVVRRWTLEAIPKPFISEDIILPIILEEKARDDFNDALISLNVWDEYQYLKGLAETREIIDVEIGGSTYKAWVVDFIQERDPGSRDWNRDKDAGKALAGIHNLFLRTVEP